jgi:hypothetical protein
VLCQRVSTSLISSEETQMPATHQSALASSLLSLWWTAACDIGLSAAVLIIETAGRIPCQDRVPSL